MLVFKISCRIWSFSCALAKIRAFASPYKSHNDAGKHDFSYIVFKWKNIGDLPDLAEFTLWYGPHGYYSGSTLQFSDLVSTMRQWTNTVSFQEIKKLQEIRGELE